ncbi:MAG: family 78 glycoside hydrolase catalytic domain [Chitinophagaceae bacterium]
MIAQYYKILFIASIFFSINTKLFAQTNGLSVLQTRVEYKDQPFTENTNPRFNWQLQSTERGQKQTAYQILVATSTEALTETKADLWNSGKVISSNTNQVVYAGKPLNSRAICFFKIRSWDKNNVVGAWSSVSKWEMALLNKTDWQAQWIGNDLTAHGKNGEYHLPPAPFFRKEVTIQSGIKKARLYVTALGLYEFYINGKKIGNDQFTPGFTDYNKRVYYQVYDVSKQLKNGSNAVGSIISDGWYAGYLGYALLVKNPVVRNFYGYVPLLKAQIEIEYNNGEKQVIVTDDTWQTNHGPFVQADILNGETYDARLEFKNWNLPNYAASNWKKAMVFEEKKERALQVYPGNPVSTFTTLACKKITQKGKEKYLFDLGQNFAGNVQLKVKGKAGDSIVIRYGEVLFPNGDLMTENLRKAKAIDTYILKGDPSGEVYTPRFTYHGFQFVEVTGLKNTPTLETIKGLVLTSATPTVGSFETDNKMINQLYQNIVWTQRSNYFDIPTDCPQRDERMGWTGDAQVYIQSAAYNNDIAAFFTKWVVDLNDAQRADATYTLYAPAPNLRITDTYSPGWSEAGIICPYTIYKNYGDTKLIEQFWPNMKAYMQFLEAKSNGTYVFKEASFEDISPKGGFGDWLSVGKKTPPDMLATMYYKYVASMMAEMATAIHKKEDAVLFENIAEKIKAAFAKHYINTDGKFITNAAAYGKGEDYVDGHMGFDGHTQTAYANAIYMDMLSADLKAKAGKALASLILQNNNKLSTGFLGVKPLLPALSATGNTKQAYQLLLSKEYPSWGFEVVNGANTIWERWNSYIKGKGFENNAGMNSFNHYAFGSVNEWLFGNAAGIQLDGVGYKTFTIKPEIADTGIGYVKATYQSINGTIVSSWKKIGKQLAVTIEVPVNTSATAFIPSKKIEQVTENGKAVQSNLYVTVQSWKDGYLQLHLTSGKYNFLVNDYFEVK